MTRKANFFSFWVFIILLFVFNSCKNSKAPEVNPLKIEVLRFEQDLFNTDLNRLKDSIPFFQRKYGEFFEMFNYKIINIGNSSSPAYADYLRGFVTDYDMNMVKENIDSVFSDFSPYEKDISEVFSYYKHYFPSQPLPVVITYMSGFNQSLVSSDTVLGIGLDKYLGRDNSFYTRLGYANYMKQNMYPGKIPSDCAKAWLMTQFSMNTDKATLFDHLIYQGKILYVSQTLMPNTADSLVLGFTEEQLDWCDKNEAAMWTYLIENKLLFNTEYSTIIKFIGEAPFTKGFGRNSPGKAATWLGYQIVKKFMDRNPEKNLEALLNETDSQKILREAKYKP